MADERHSEPLVRVCIEQLVTVQGSRREPEGGGSAPFPLMAAELCTAPMTAPETSTQQQRTLLHEALRCPQLRDLVDSLRPETQREIIRGMAGLPFGFKVGRECEGLQFGIKMPRECSELIWVGGQPKGAHGDNLGIPCGSA